MDLAACLGGAAQRAAVGVGDGIGSRAAAVRTDAGDRGDSRSQGIDPDVTRAAGAILVACHIGLPDLHSASLIVSVGQGKAIAAAVRPVHAAVSAVLPSGAGFQAGNLDEAVTGDAIGAITAGIAGKGQCQCIRTGVHHKSTSVATGGAIPGPIGLSDLHGAGGVIAGNQGKAVTATGSPVRPAVAAVLPKSTLFQAGDLDRPLAGDAVASDTAVGLQDQDRDDQGSINGDTHSQKTRGAIARQIDLPDLHGAGGIGTGSQREAAAAAIGPACAVVGAVLPGGPRLQASDIDGTVVGDAVCGCAAVQRQGESGKPRSLVDDNIPGGAGNGGTGLADIGGQGIVAICQAGSVQAAAPGTAVVTGRTGHFAQGDIADGGIGLARGGESAVGQIGGSQTLQQVKVAGSDDAAHGNGGGFVPIDAVVSGDDAQADGEGSHREIPGGLVGDGGGGIARDIEEGSRIDLHVVGMARSQVGQRIECDDGAAQVDLGCVVSGQGGDGGAGRVVLDVDVLA